MFIEHCSNRCVQSVRRMMTLNHHLYGEFAMQAFYTAQFYFLLNLLNQNLALTQTFPDAFVECSEVDHERATL